MAILNQQRPILMTAPSMTAPTMTQGALSSGATTQGQFMNPVPLPPQRMLIAGVDVPEAAYGDELIDEIPPTVPMIDTAPPVLSQAAQAQRGVLSQPMTGNARGSNKPPSMRVPFNEALIRIGGAIVGGSAQGGTAGLSAGANAYGQIQDANRAADMANFEIEEARRNEARRQQIAASMERGRAAREEANRDFQMQLLEAKAKGKAQNIMPDATYNEFALTAIEDVEKLVTNEKFGWPLDNTTGLTGSLLSSVPGSAAHDVLKQLDTIKASIGFERLQAMRDAAPSGASGLGQVTEKEIGFLQAAMGSLEQSQSKEQFLKNLAAVKKQYIKTINALRAQQAEHRRINGLPASPSQATPPPSPSSGTDYGSPDLNAAMNQYGG